MMRTIMHLDMDSYFASVEQQATPALRKRPIGVTGKPHKCSVVVAASREAKPHGVKSGMRVAEAQRLCPNLTLVPGNAERYIAVTKRFLSILKRYTAMLEVFSIDEVFMEVSQEAGEYGGPIAMARVIQDEFAEELGSCITCTIGIAPNKALAKLIVRNHKPTGIGVVQQEDIPTLLEKTPVIDVCGIGKQTERKLAKLGIRTLADLGRAPTYFLRATFGKYGLYLQELGNGRDSTPVIPYTTMSPVKSVGHSKTLPPQLRAFDLAIHVVHRLCDKVSRRMRKLGYVGRTVHFSFRCGVVSPHRGKQATLTTPTNDGEVIYNACMKIHRMMDINPLYVSQVAVSVSNLTEYSDLPEYLLEEDRKKERLNRVSDDIRDQFGEKAISTADALFIKGVPEHVGGFAEGEQWEF